MIVQQRVKCGALRDFWNHEKGYALVNDRAIIHSSEILQNISSPQADKYYSLWQVVKRVLSIQCL